VLDVVVERLGSLSGFGDVAFARRRIACTAGGTGAVDRGGG
jgi:hypothetical protein